MKKVLLTTTALVMTAGVASAEITFSGKGEAGVYRTAPTAAVAAVAGRKTTTANNTTVTAANSAATAKTATADIVEYVDGVLTTVAAGGTLGTIPANAASGANPATSGSVAEQESAVRAAVEAVRAAELVLARLGATADLDDIDTETNDVAIAKANLAREQAKLANMKGSDAVAKGATPKLVAYSGYDFNVALSGASDNGMTFAMGFDMGAGHIADQDDDRAMDAQGGSIANDELTITYAGYTVGIGNDLIDDLYDDTQNGDISLAGSLGDLTFSLVTDMDDDVKEVKAATKFTAASGGAVGTSTHVNAKYEEVAAVAAVYNPTSYAIGYTMGNIAFSMAGTEHDDRGHAAAKMSLTYTVSDATTVKLESDNVGTYKDIAKVSLTQKLSDAITITASMKDDKDHALNTNKNKAQSSDISVAYSAGALGATLATDEGSNWWVNAQYDLGGGAQAFTTFDHTEFLVAGVNFKF
jgi:hypothetical protein